MILLDFSGTIFAALYVDLKEGATPNVDYIRHICLNTLRTYNRQFRHKYGEMVVCFDSRSWRELEFKYYKYSRKHNRVDDGYNWDEIYKMFSDIQQEMTENMPYKTVQALGAEGDDIISIMAKNATEPVLIVSNDKDFPQLMVHKHIHQYRPCVKTMNEIEDPERFLFDMLIAGDKEDGIPNIKCSDDFFKQQIIDKSDGNKPKRAPAITQKFKDELWDIYSENKDKFYDYLKQNSMLDNFKRNNKLINLVDDENIPDMILSNINKSVDAAKNNSDMKMIRYFQKHKLQLLSRCIEDFSINKLKPTLF